MPVPPATAKQFLFLSDYSIDKVVWKKNGVNDLLKAASGGANTVTLTIPHGLGYTPLVQGIYSPNNFRSRYTAGTSPRFFDSTTQLNLYRYGMQVAADSTNVYIYLESNDGRNRLWWKIVCLAPEVPALVPAVTTPQPSEPETRAFSFNTDLNYQKIFLNGLTGYQTINGSSTTFTVPHNLGYIPTALAYLQLDTTGVLQEATDFMHLITNDFNFTISARASLDAQNLTVTVDNGSGMRNIRLMYRIYLDD